MKTWMVVLSLVMASSPSPLHEDLGEEWAAFKTEHNRVFTSSEEETRRFENFAQNRRMILEHNKLYEQGLVSFRMKVNHFADQSRADRRGNRTIARPSGGRRFVGGRGALPEALDWRRRGYVTEVKDQDKCGACWSFSATGALEGQHFRRTGRLVSLSEQNLIDCAGGSDGYDGCDGGDMERAYKYVIANGGIDSERDYPFEKKGGPCRYSAPGAAATARELVLLDEGDEEQLLGGPCRYSAPGAAATARDFVLLDEGDEEQLLGGPCRYSAPGAAATARDFVLLDEGDEEQLLGGPCRYSVPGAAATARDFVLLDEGDEEQLLGGPCRYSAPGAAATARDFVLLDEGDEEQLLGGPCRYSVPGAAATARDFVLLDEGDEEQLLGGPCRYSAPGAAATARDFVLLDEGDEEQLLRAVTAVGPVAVGIDSSPASFHFYDEGVYSDEDCSSEQLDHAVLVAGYGQQDGRPYWLVKNSWGAGWGQGGYMRLARGRGNHCGVATYASYPLV